MSDELTRRLLAVLALCESMVEQIPPEFEVTSWEVHPDYLGGQMDSESGLAVCRTRLRDLADRFGLAYSESQHSTLTQLDAETVLDNIRIHLWAQIVHPRTAPRPESEY